MQNATDWLKKNSGPQDLVTAKMAETTFYRKSFIHSKDNPSVKEIVTEFPHLLDTGMVSFTI